MWFIGVAQISAFLISRPGWTRPVWSIIWNPTCFLMKPIGTSLQVGGLRVDRLSTACYWDSCISKIALWPYWISITATVIRVFLGFRSHPDPNDVFLIGVSSSRSIYTKSYAELELRISGPSAPASFVSLSPHVGSKSKKWIFPLYSKMIMPVLHVPIGSLAFE